MDGVLPTSLAAEYGYIPVPVMFTAGSYNETPREEATPPQHFSHIAIALRKVQQLASTNIATEQMTQRAVQYQPSHGQPFLFPGASEEVAMPVDGGTGVTGAACSNDSGGPISAVMSRSRNMQIPEYPTRRKRTTNRPKKNLSAYNLFFKDEREKVIKEIEGRNSAPDRLGDTTQKRRNIRHGVGFQDMAKIIGKKGKEISSERLSVYERRRAEIFDRACDLRGAAVHRL
jgi:hypothetical protein